MDQSKGLCAVFRNERINRQRCKKIENVDSTIEKYRNENWCVKVFDNFTAVEMYKKLNSFENDPTLNCFEVYKFVFFGHGGIDESKKNFIFSADGKDIPIQNITNCFQDFRCINLKGKFKSFEFYTCDFVPESVVHNESDIVGIIDDREKYRRDLVRDMVVMWSTVSGFVSYRSPDGTYFIIALCKKLQEQCKEKEITDILRNVQTEVDNYEEADKSIKVTEMQTIRFDKLFYFYPETVLATEPDKKWNIYDLNQRKKRLCLIINIKNFRNKGFKTREGSEKDVANIDQMFKSLDFEVVKLNDLKQSEITKKIKDVTNECYDVEAFALFIMSHGGKSRNMNVIYGYDRGTVTIDEIINLFKDDECPQLKNVPKFIFVVACRGVHKAVVDINNRSMLSEDCATGELTELDPNVHSDSSGDTSPLSPTRDLLLMWSRFHKAPMREMVAGARFSDYLLQNMMQFVTGGHNLEIMQVPRYVDTVCKIIGVRKQHIDLNAIGLRKYLYVFRLFQRQFADNEYKLTSIPTGFLLILNNHFFQNHPNTALDSNDYVGYFTKAFTMLQYQVVVKAKVNLFLDTVKEALNDPRIKSHDTFILMISTELIEENGRQFLIGYNGERCDVENLKALFNEDRCPALKGKPKLIFFLSSNELELHDERSEEEVLIREQMEKIFDTSLDLINHAESGCSVNYYTPFANFTAGNFEFEQRSELLTHLSNINDVIEPAFRNVLLRSQTEQSDQEASSASDISPVIGRLVNVPADDYKIYQGETAYRFNRNLHRSSGFQPNLLDGHFCFCDWIEDTKPKP